MKNIRFWQFYKNNKGSYILEACIILPIVLVGILSVGIMSKSYYNSFKIKTQLDDEVRLSMIADAISPLKTDLAARVTKRIFDNKNSNIGNFAIKSYRSDFMKMGIDSLIAMEVEYTNKFNLSIIDKENRVSREKVLARMFVGDNGNRKRYSFDSMEKDEKSNIVFIFPNDGYRYHSKFCSYVTPKVSVQNFDNIDKGRYMPCPMCNAKNIKTGKVYVFEEFGDYYHMENCNTVRKNCIKTTEQKAIERGYSRCSKCQGYGGERLN